MSPAMRELRLIVRMGVYIVCIFAILQILGPIRLSCLGPKSASILQQGKSSMGFPMNRLLCGGKLLQV